jgi:hypothetical protein
VASGFCDSRRRGFQQLINKRGHGGHGGPTLPPEKARSGPKGKFV